MEVITYEAIVENGLIKLPASIHLPEQTKVFVVVPSLSPLPRLHIASPRLARPEQAMEFIKDVTEDAPNAELR